MYVKTFTLFTFVGKLKKNIVITTKADVCGAVGGDPFTLTNIVQMINAEDLIYQNINPLKKLFTNSHSKCPKFNRSMISD